MHDRAATAPPRGQPRPAPLLGADLLARVQQAGILRRVPRGETLIEAGSKADAFYIVLQGRFEVFVGEHPIAEIAAGEPIGEIAFFAGGRRTARVTAARASEVVEIGRTQYDRLVHSMPELPGAIIAALAGRLRASVPEARALAPRAGQTIGLFPAGSGTLDPALAAYLTQELLRGPGSLAMSGPGDLMGATLAERLTALGADDPAILTCTDPTARPDWADAVFENADTLLFVLDRRQPGPHTPSALEKKAARTMLPTSLHLAILRDTGAGDPRGTAALLKGRGLILHHHVRAGHAGDIERLARFLAGSAMGIVFGGGGAFGTAHMGLIKALEEHGFAFDIVGGASIGTTMAAAYAAGMSPDEVIDRCDAFFLRSGAMKRLTVPFHSVIDHTHFDARLRDQFGQRRLEDLPLNCYAVATSLTTNDLKVIRRGEVWRAARASSSIPAVYPPMVMEDGEVLIDGAFIDNVPVETMRALKPGQNLVLSLEHLRPWRINTPYDDVPGRSGALKRLFLGKFTKRVRFPGIFSVMIRSMIVNSENRLAAVERGSDIFMPIRPLRGMGFLEWERGRELFDLTYRRTADALDEASATLSGPDLLRAVADKVSRASAAPPRPTRPKPGSPDS